MPVSKEWTPRKVRMLRGKRTQAEFGKLIHVPKNTIWRWEAGYAKPDAERADRLTRLARKERFHQDWKLAGSAELLGDLEEGSKILREQFEAAWRRGLENSR